MARAHCRHAAIWGGLLLSVAIAHGQTARLNGRITDASGGIVPEASITVTNQETGVVRRTRSNEAGSYSVPLLKPGKYSIVVRKEGFRPISRRDIPLEVDRRAAIDFVLDVGTIVEEIQISVQLPGLNTSDASLGQLIENKRIVEMPLNGRDYVALALLSAGTVQAVGGRFGGFSVAGQKTTQNNYLLDGMDNNSIELAGAGRRAEMVKPSIDAIQEFKVQTNSYSAEFGRAMGGIINVTTKSGTNQWHGSAFWFLRNEALDAKNYFDPPDKGKPPFKRNQFGGAVGGPILRNRTFFFGDYEGTRIRESRTATSTIPTPAMRKGDFSSLGKPIIDPATGAPFASGVIPSNRMDPLASRLVELYPVPRRGDLSANFVHQSPDREDVGKFDLRVDHKLSDATNVFYRISYHDRVFPAALALPAPAFGGGHDGTVTGWNTGLNFTHAFSANLIASVRTAWNYAQFTRANPAEAGIENLNARYGVHGVDQTQPGGFSSFNIAGYRNLGLGGFNGVDRDSQNRQIAADFTYNRGRHALKFGANILRSQNNIFNIRKEVGVFKFNGRFTGDAMADFLLGATDSLDWSNRLQTNLRGWLFGFFVQDDWRITPRLTLNLGVRYELNLPWREQRDRMANFDIETDPANPRLILAGSPAAGSGYRRRSLTRADTNNVMPRAGIAYKVTRRTVLRAGYGIFHGYLEPSGDAQFLIGNPPFAWSVQQTSSPEQPVFRLSDGPTDGSLSLENANGLKLSSYERQPSREYSQQWNVNIQRDLGRNWLFEVGYAGSRGSHLLVRHEGNFAPPGPGNLDQKRPLKSAEIPGTGLVASPLGPVIYHHFSGNVNYNALVSRLEKRFSHGLALLGSYTFSKTIGDTCGFAASGNTLGCGYQDPRNFRLERSVDNQDVPHRLVLSGIWEVPVGHGRRWMSDLGGTRNALLGGWAIGSIVSYGSGRPYNVVVPGNPANTGSVAIVNRPNVVGDPYTGNRTVERDFNIEAFVRNKQFEIGNLGRNALRQRGAFGWDLSLYKDVPVREEWRLQLRFEAFQLTNTPRFGTPGNQVGTANFGRITDARTPRNLQLGMKLVF